jgi:type VII secretion integral membrane protein EccD
LEPPPVPTAYSRVTVVSDARRVDLALPSALPLSDVMPQLLGFCAPDGRPEHPVGWALARLGGGPLPLSTTLADAGVTDGDVLELRTGAQIVHPAYAEDVRDVVEDTIDRSARQWQPRTTAGFALAAGGVGLGLVALLPQAWQPRSAGGLASAVLLVALLVPAGWWAAQRGHRHAALLLVAVAAGWGGVAGALLASYPRWPPAAAVGSALAGGLLVAALARALTPVATVHLAALGPLAAAGAGTGAVALAGADPLAGVRVAALAAVLVVGVLPRVSLTVGGLASADYRVRTHGLVGGAELAGRIAQSSALLSGGLIGTALAGVAGGVLLAGSGSGWDRLLGTAVGLALLLRSRVFSRIPQIVPLRAAGLAVLAVQGGYAVQQSAALQPWVVAIAAGLAAGAVAVSAVPLSEVARARAKQLLNRAELVVVVAVVALAAAALGLFDRVAELTPG